MIDAQLAAFLQEGLGIHIGTRDARLQPEGARALAARVETGGRYLVVYAAEVAARRLLPHLEANGQVAVSFGRPEDHRACQVKGTVAGIAPASDEERPAIAAQWASFLRQLDGVGIPSVTTTAWTTWPAVAIRLKVTALFEQTPRPGTGEPIG
jgi:hypothetical protein